MINVKDVDWPLFFGCLLIAFSPSIAFFFMIVSRRAQLVIIAITSAFYWLVAILVTAFIWYIIPPLKTSVQATVPISVLIQELFRWLLYKSYEKSEKAILAVSTPNSNLPLNDSSSAFASGVGFGTMYAVVMYGSILAASIQTKGATYATACPHLPLVFVSALYTLAFFIMHLALMMIAFSAYRRQSLIHTAIVVILHMAISCTTLVNQSKDGCNVSLPLVYGMTLCSCFAAVLSLRSSFAP